MLAPLAFALLCATPLKMDIVVRDLKDGDVLSEIRKFRITVQSDHPVNQVEFYVGDNLRGSDSSTPYEFDIDPLNEADGTLKVSFAAYNTEGENSKKSFNLSVDTGVSKGAQKNVDDGYSAMAKRDFDRAIFLGRVALKAQTGFNPARVLLARAFMSKGVYDKAQTFAEDALASDPNLDEANEVLAAISFKQAFEHVVITGGVRDVAPIRAALLRGAEFRRKTLMKYFEAVGAPNDQNYMAYAKAALRAGRVNAAIQALSPVYRKDTTQTSIGNLLAFAQIRDSSFSQANVTIGMLEKANAMDGYSFALKAILLAQAGKDADCDAMMSEAIGNDPDGIGVKLAQAAIALKRGRTNALANQVASLSRDESPRPEVNYYLSILQDRLQNYAEADRRFLQAILAEPASVDLLVERGNQSVRMLTQGRITDDAQKKIQIELGGAYFNAALAAQPDSPQALTGIMIYYGSIGKSDQALAYADAATRAGPGYAAAHFAASLVYSAAQNDITKRASAIRKDSTGNLTSAQIAELSQLDNDAREMNKRSTAALKKSIELDPAGLDGRTLPSLSAAYDYFVRHGRIPLLVVPQ